MKAKKILAVVLSAAMVLGCGITSMADNSNTSVGEGTFNGIASGQIVKVIFPTLAQQEKTTFSYIADPQNLIKATVTSGGITGKSWKGVDINPNDQRVYFNVTSGASTTYASTSTKLRITNKGMKNVDVSINAEVNDASNTNNMKLVDKTTANDALNNGAPDLTGGIAEPSIYLGLVGDHYAKNGSTNNIDTKVVTTGGVTLTDTLVGAAENYELVFDEETSYGYTYDRKATIDESLWEYTEFYLEGICPGSANLKSTTIAPTINITYSWEDPTSDKAPTFTASTDTAGLITVDEGRGNLALDNIDSITVIGYDQSTYDIYNALAGVWSAATYSGGKIQIDSNALAGFNRYTTKQVTIKYTNNKGDEVETTVDLKFT